MGELPHRERLHASESQAGRERFGRLTNDIGPQERLNIYTHAVRRINQRDASGPPLQQDHETVAETLGSFPNLEIAILYKTVPYQQRFICDVERQADGKLYVMRDLACEWDGWHLQCGKIEDNLFMGIAE